MTDDKKEGSPRVYEPSSRVNPFRPPEMVLDEETFARLVEEGQELRRAFDKQHPPRMPWERGG